MIFNERKQNLIVKNILCLKILFKNYYNFTVKKTNGYKKAV
jgi:hypothetical protein